MAGNQSSTAGSSDCYAAPVSVLNWNDIALTRADLVCVSRLAHLVSAVNLSVICLPLSAAGIVGNVLNMVVLRRQGFLNVINRFLFAIAVSDLLVLASSIWIAICHNPYFSSLDLPFSPLGVELVTGQIPHVLAMAITSFLTATVTLERCLCIARPLEVQRIFTARTTTAFVVFTFFLAFSFGVPALWSSWPEWKMDPSRNRSVLVLRYEYHTPSDYASTAAIVVTSLTSFSTVVVCTVVLVVKLRQQSRWRRQTSSAHRTIDAKEQRLMKLILMIAILFIVTNVLNLIMMIACLSYDCQMGTGSDLYTIVLSFAVVMETINASANILIYYTMSLSYKTHLRALFRCR